MPESETAMDAVGAGAWLHSSILLERGIARAFVLCTPQLGDTGGQPRHTRSAVAGRELPGYRVGGELSTLIESERVLETTGDVNSLDLDGFQNFMRDVVNRFRLADSG
jgi:hypothetical protein